MNTPDTEWENSYDAMVEDARLYSDFPDMLAEHIKGYVRKERSSRDTYWKKRTRKQDIKNQQLKKGLRTAQKTISKLQTELATRDTYWKERVRKEVEKTHKSELEELAKSNNQETTKTYIRKGLELYKAELLQALDNLK